MNDPDATDEVRPEYDFSKGARGKYAERYAEGANIVVLDPDVAKVFKSSDEVNDALRKLMKARGEDESGAA